MLLGRMSGSVDLAKVGDGEVGVFLGGGEFGVAEYFLNVQDVGTVLKHVSGHGVTEKMAKAGFVDVGHLFVFSDTMVEADGL